MNYLKYGIGIDMAKDNFDVCLSVIDTTQLVTIKATSSFANNLKGFTAFLSWSLKHLREALPAIYLLEATGIYHEHLAWYLFDNDCKVVVVLPNKAKKYKESLGLKSKTDSIDAKGLSRYACEQNLRLWQPVSKKIYGLRIITRQIEALSVQATQVQNQLHSLLHGMYRLKDIEKMLSKQLALLQQQKDSMHQQLLEVIEQDAVLKERFEKILKIKGLGALSLAIIIAETDGFAATQSIAQLTSYAGYDVVENQSGNRKGKTKISKKGNGHIRRALHFPSLNMVRYEQANFHLLYKRIYNKSNIKMKGYAAVQRKLLALIYTLWKKNEPFNNTFQKQASGNEEPGPSLASALQKPGKKIASGKPEATQDKLPSTNRRKPSLAYYKGMKKG